MGQSKVDIQDSQKYAYVTVKGRYIEQTVVGIGTVKGKKSKPEKMFVKFKYTEPQI